MSISNRSLMFVLAFVAALSLFAHDREALAQKYRGADMPPVYDMTPRPYKINWELEVDRDRKRAQQLRKAQQLRDREHKKRNSAAFKAISSGESKVKAAGDVIADAEARKFLEEYSLPAMTQPDADTLSSLGDMRQDFLELYLSERVTGGARTKMIDFSVDKLQAYALDQTLHPSARVNAIVLLSQLTDRPLDVARGQTPIASAKAFDSLMDIHSGQDPKQNPEFVKVAALSGIVHQIDLNTKSGQTVSSTAKSELVDSAMELMAAPADRETQPGAYWKKRQAVLLAGLLGDAKTLPALLAVLNDETASFELKLEVVKRLPKRERWAPMPKLTTTLLCRFVSSPKKRLPTKRLIFKVKSIKWSDHRCFMVILIS